MTSIGHSFFLWSLGPLVVRVSKRYQNFTPSPFIKQLLKLL